MEQPFPKYALFNGKLHTFVKRVEPVPRTTHHRNCETPGASAACETRGYIFIPLTCNSRRRQSQQLWIVRASEVPQVQHDLLLRKQVVTARNLRQA